MLEPVEQRREFRHRLGQQPVMHLRRVQPQEPRRRAVQEVDFPAASSPITPAVTEDSTESNSRRWSSEMR